MNGDVIKKIWKVHREGSPEQDLESNMSIQTGEYIYGII